MSNKREIVNYTLSVVVLILAIITWVRFSSEIVHRPVVSESVRGVDKQTGELGGEISRSKDGLGRDPVQTAAVGVIANSTPGAQNNQVEALESGASEIRPGWDPTLSQKWLRGDPSEPPRLDPGSVDPDAPMFFNPYRVEHLKREETIAEIHEIYNLNRSEEERLVSLDVLRMSWLGEAGMDKEKAFPEELATDALQFMSKMKQSERRWMVLANLSGLEYGIVRDEARAYLENDQDSDVRKRAATALAPFRDDPEIEKLLRHAAAWDPSHAVRRYAEAALAGNWRYSKR